MQSTQAPVKPAADLLVLLTQAEGVVGVGRHALHAEEQRAAQGHHVRVAPPQPPRVYLRQLMRRLLRPADIAPQGLVVEIHVGQRGEQAVRQQAGDLRRELTLFGAGLRQVDQRADQMILQIGGLGLLSADAGADAAAVARRLLALETEHFRHRWTSLKLLYM